MIAKFEGKGDSAKYLTLPKMTEFSDFSLERGDTLVVFMNFDKYDIKSCQEFHNRIIEMFPNNQVLMLPLDSRLEVIKENDKKLF